MSVCNALSKAVIDKVHFQYTSTVSESLGHVCISRSLGKSQGHSSQKHTLFGHTYPGSTIARAGAKSVCALCREHSIAKYVTLRAH